VHKNNIDGVVYTKKRERERERERESERVREIDQREKRE
jgi:hypothetical protein